MRTVHTIDEQLNLVATWKVAPNSNFGRLFIFDLEFIDFNV